MVKSIPKHNAYAFSVAENLLLPFTSYCFFNLDLHSEKVFQSDKISNMKMMFIIQVARSATVFRFQLVSHLRPIQPDSCLTSMLKVTRTHRTRKAGSTAL